MTRHRPRAIALAPVLFLLAVGLGGCHHFPSTPGGADPASTYPVESAHAMRDRSRELIRELLAAIPDDLRTFNGEEERNETITRQLSACHEYNDVTPEDWDGSYTYLGGLGVDMRGPEEAEQAVERIVEKLQEEEGWGEPRLEQTDHGLAVFITSADGFEVSARAITSTDQGPIVMLGAVSPCFYPAESPWPRNSEL